MRDFCDFSFLYAPRSSCVHNNILDLEHKQFLRINEKREKFTEEPIKCFNLIFLIFFCCAKIMRLFQTSHLTWMMRASGASLLSHLLNKKTMEIHNLALIVSYFVRFSSLKNLIFCNNPQIIFISSRLHHHSLILMLFIGWILHYFTFSRLLRLSLFCSGKMRNTSENTEKKVGGSLNILCSTFTWCNFYVCCFFCLMRSEVKEWKKKFKIFQNIFQINPEYCTLMSMRSEFRIIYSRGSWRK